MNTQFQIPTYNEGSIDPELRRQVDEVFESPEIQEGINGNESFHTAKQVEAEVEQLRALATEATLPSRGFLGGVAEKVGIISPQSLETRLVNAEGKIGGDLLPDMEGIIFKRFFFYKGYWYLELQDKSGRMVASYQIHEDSAHKLFNGREVNFDESQHELENLLAIIPLYKDEVQRRLYQPELQQKMAAKMAEHERIVQIETERLDAEIEALFEQEGKRDVSQ